MQEKNLDRKINIEKQPFNFNVVFFDDDTGLWRVNFAIDGVNVFDESFQTRWLAQSAMVEIQNSTRPGRLQ